MRIQLILSAACLVLGCGAASEAQPAPDLRLFFEMRLADKGDTPPPAYAALLAVVDTIRTSSPDDLRAALPLISASLRSKTPNVAVEAVFCASAISRRPDGGMLLRNKIPDLVELLSNSDERLSGGSLMTLQMLTGSNSDLIVPALIAELQRSENSRFLKSAIIHVLLESQKRNDDKVLRAIENYLSVAADEPRVRIANMQAIGASRVTTPVIASYVLNGLMAKDEQVQIAAIQATFRLDEDIQKTARPVWSRLVEDPATPERVRFFARRALENKLHEPDPGLRFR